MSKEQIPDRDISNKQIAEAALQLKIRGLIERGETTLTLQESDIAAVSKEMLAEAIREGGFQAVVTERDFLPRARVEYGPSTCSMLFNSTTHNFKKENLDKLVEAFSGTSIQHFTTCVDNITEEQQAELKRTLDENNISSTFLSKEAQAEYDIKERLRNFIEQQDTLPTMMRPRLRATTFMVPLSQLILIRQETLEEVIREGSFQAVGNGYRHSKKTAPRTLEVLTDCYKCYGPEYGSIRYTAIMNILQAIKNSTVTSLTLNPLLAYKWGLDELYGMPYLGYVDNYGKGISREEIEIEEQSTHRIMQALRENTSLKSITLFGSISSKGLRELVELIKENDIEHLSVTNNKFLLQDINIIADSLALNSTLRSLHLTSNRTYTFPFMTLKNNTTLKEFVFVGNSLPNGFHGFPSALTLLQYNTSLEKLSISRGFQYPLTWSRDDIPPEENYHFMPRQFLAQIDAKLEENRLFREREAAIVSAVTLVGRVAHLDSRVDVLSTKMNVHDEMVEEISQTLAIQTGKLHNLQPQLFEGNRDNLVTLAAASPQTIRYLETLGDSGTQAETQYNHIRSSDELYSYYNTLNRSLTSTLMASHSIFSGMVGDDRSCTSTQLLSLANSAAKSTGIPGVSLITGIIKFLGNEMESREKQQTLNRITARFPTTRHYALIEIFARELTLQQADIIGEAHKQTPKGIMEKAMGMVRWLQADDIDTPVKALATSHAASLLDTIMQTDPAIAIEPHDIPMLMAWATNDPALLEAVNTSLPVTHQPQNSHSSSVKQEEVETLRQQLTVERAARERQEKRLNSIERALQSQKTSSQKGAVTSYNDGNGLMQLQLHAIDESTQHNGTTAEVSRADFRALTQIVSRQEAALTDTISAVLQLREDTASQGHVATIAKKSKEVTFGGRK